MICLDTNYLILGLVRGSREGAQLLAWMADGETLVAPSVVWYEFLCGPVTERQVSVMRAIVGQVVPFNEHQAAMAAQLFNQAGRKRSTRVDAMIAAAAISLDAAFATNNTEDFAEFRLAGLRMV